MQRKSFGNMQCPVARSLERVGEWWSILILRDALHGFTRFDQFQKSLGIAPNMLTRRLNALVEAQLLERRRYSEHPPRDEYVLTARGRDFRPVIVALLAFGNKHFAPEGASVLLVDARTGREADPVLVDRVSGQPIEEPDYVYVPGPAAGERTRRKFAAAAAKHEPAARMKRKRNPGPPLPHSAIAREDGRKRPNALHAGYKRRRTK
jgi:DNA-binding HxlR family transcriptional regulator